MGIYSCISWQLMQKELRPVYAAAANDAPTNTATTTTAASTYFIHLCTRVLSHMSDGVAKRQSVRRAFGVMRVGPASGRGLRRLASRPAVL